ncbi:PIN domain-containing protein [uncultured Methanobacterium sp.]|uniref:PIN domain-containing protein n=1 Tax=uncultured Methanobacterium sp. TaxID=176306 RepID=UPI002AA71A36|nr:PIN domain-containing protein [uncultured Methanobacterium sp.]
MQIKGYHFIDASIFASVVFEDVYQRECLRYLNRVSKIYKGSTSLLALGELYLSFLKNINDNTQRANSFFNITGLIENLLLEYVTLDIPYYLQCVEKINYIDPRIDITDTKLLAEALGQGVDTFVTTDNKILSSQKINDLINVKHPTDLI